MRKRSAIKTELGATALRLEEVRGRGLRLSTKEIALISVYAAVWIVAEVTLGPVIGRFTVGPFSLHGVINRVVGWMLMLFIAEMSGRFGRASLMAVTAVLGTRMIRVSLLEGIVVGIGYTLGGLIFDLMLFMPYARGLRGRSRALFAIASSVISGTLANTPYILWRFSALSLEAFVALTPTYVISTVKGVLFSTLGVALGLLISPRIKPISTLVRI